MAAVESGCSDAKPFGSSHLAKGRGFEQINRDLLQFHWPELIVNCPNAAALFCRLMSRATQSNTVHRKHERRMLIEMSISQRSFYRALAQLEERYWILRDEHEIHLNARICWHGRKPATLWNCELMCEPVMPAKRDEKWLKLVERIS